MLWQKPLPLMVRAALKYGYAKARFTVNATFHQISAAPAAQAVKVAVRKAQHHLAVVATKEAANVAVNAEAAVATEEVDKVVVETNAAGVIVRVDQVARVVAKVVIVQVAVTVRVVQEEDRIDLRCEI